MAKHTDLDRRLFQLAKLEETLLEFRLRTEHERSELKERIVDDTDVRSIRRSLAPQKLTSRSSKNGPDAKGQDISSTEYDGRERIAFRRPSFGPRVIAPIEKRIHVQAAAAGFKPFQIARTKQGSIAFFEAARSICVKFEPEAKPKTLTLASVKYSIKDPKSELAKKKGLLEVDDLTKLQVDHFLNLYNRNPRKFSISWR